MADLRVGLVGAGMVAAHHLISWSRCPGAQVVAIADPDAAAIARLGAHDSTAFATLTEMIEGATLDAVDIAAPAAVHAELVLAAVAAGLPTLCQKPLAPSLAEAQALVSSLPDGARVMLHENWRWRPNYRTLREMLVDRQPPRSFELRVESAGLCPLPDGTFPALARQPFLADLNRLIVFELLGHHLDVLSFLFGPISVKEAQVGRQCTAVRGEDHADITLSAGGIPGRLFGTFVAPDAPPRPRDTLLLDTTTVLSDWKLSMLGVERVWDHDAAYQCSYDDCIAHFAICVAEGRPFETPIQHGVTLLSLTQDVYREAGFSIYFNKLPDSKDC